MYKLHPALARILRVLASVGLVCAVLAVVFRVPGNRLTTVSCALMVAIISLGEKWGRSKRRSLRWLQASGLGWPALLTM
jgi:hypothetical protein